MQVSAFAQDWLHDESSLCGISLWLRSSATSYSWCPIRRSLSRLWHRCQQSKNIDGGFRVPFVVDALHALAKLVICASLAFIVSGCTASVHASQRWPWC